MTQLQLLIGLAAISALMYLIGYLKGAIDEESKWTISRGRSADHRPHVWVEDRRK